MKPEQLHPSQPMPESMMSYDDLSSHKALMIGDEQHDISSRSTPDKLWVLYNPGPQVRPASPKRASSRWVSALQGARSDGLHRIPSGEGVYSDGNTPHVG